MDTLTGILLDVSGSMKSSAGERPNIEGGNWARSIFRVVDGLIEHDVSSSNLVFALGFGASREPEAFDLLNTSEENTELPASYYKQRRLENILEEILTILEENGAPRVRKWAQMGVLLKVVKEFDACLLHGKLAKNRHFRYRFVYNCLPETCRVLELTTPSLIRETGYTVAGWVDSVVSAVQRTFNVDETEGYQEYATKDSVKEVVSKGKELMKEYYKLVRIGPGAIMNVQKASDILGGGIDKGKLTNQRVDELMETVEHLIYGRTPLIQTINAAKKLFAITEFRNYNKLMLILSDGKPSDDYFFCPKDELSELGVTTVCCYITDDEISDPKRLYSTRCETWGEPAKLMFDMSSTITTQKIPLTIFVDRKWDIDITNNETRLFVQVNHPEFIKDVCELAKEVVCCQEALSRVLSSVYLDLYINQANQGLRPQEQVGETCYAIASATVLHLTMHSIIGLEDEIPSFFDLRDDIIKKYGEKGADTLKVLQEFCPKYRLRCQEVNALDAMKAVAANRPVVARFGLTRAEWSIFKKFFTQTSPEGILTKSDLDIKKRPENCELIWHAVVLISFNSECLILMNSQGSNFGNGGFFKIARADVLDLKFIYVYWKPEDLTQFEKDEYKRKGQSIALEMFSKLKGLRMTRYTCPECHISSYVSQFTGNHLEATCPKCKTKFNIKKAGDDLALNLYFLSISARPK